MGIKSRNEFYLFMQGDIAFWLGGSDEQNEGQWEWVTGSCNWEWTDWGPGFLSGIHQNCLEIEYPSRWNDVGCHNENKFLCELY